MYYSIDGRLEKSNEKNYKKVKEDFINIPFFQFTSATNASLRSTSDINVDKDANIKGDINLDGKTYIIQGYGNVGSNTAILLSHLGLTCIAVGDHSGYIKNDEGFNVYKLRDHVCKNKSIDGYSGEKITKEDFFGLHCDILIPAALELVVCGDEAKNLNCKMVAEAANGPLDLEADKILEERNIDVIPDILANSGGVVVSYYEWLQNKRTEYWSREEVLNKLENRMIETYKKVMNYKNTNSNAVSMRMASYILSLKNIESVYLKKGFLL